MYIIICKSFNTHTQINFWIKRVFLLLLDGHKRIYFSLKGTLYENSRELYVKLSISKGLIRVGENFCKRFYNYIVKLIFLLFTELKRIEIE